MSSSPRPSTPSSPGSSSPSSPALPCPSCWRCLRARRAGPARPALLLACAAALLTQALLGVLAAPDDAVADDAVADATASEDGDGGGLLSALRALVRATASRLSGLLGHGEDAEDAEDADVVPDGQRVRYHGYQLVRVRLGSRRQASQLRRLVEQEGAQLWRHARGNRTADVLLSPAVAPTLKDSLDDMGLSYKVLSADVQKIISFQNPPRASNRRRASTVQDRGHPFTWKRYHRYEDIVSYLYYLAANYPQLAQVLAIGTSSEGRPLFVLKISSSEPRRERRRPRLANATARAGRVKKPAIWIDAGTHGREWIGPAVALYVCMQLVERAARQPHLTRDADWYVMPVLNPDGYEYSHTTDRLWRKTRSAHELAGPAGPAGTEAAARLFGRRGPCSGVDLNRNWDYNWGDRRGASDNPCSDMYAGPRPFSEPEARAAATFIARRQERLQVFLSLHSYSQLWLIPEDASYRRLADHQELHNKAALAVRALRRVRNTRYQIGTASEMLYTISGCADNWAKAVAGVKYAYTVELPDRGRYGFLLPSHFITPTGKETFAAVKELAQAVICKP